MQNKHQGQASQLGQTPKFGKENISAGAPLKSKKKRENTAMIINRVHVFQMTWRLKMEERWKLVITAMRFSFSSKQRSSYCTKPSSSPGVIGRYHFQAAPPLPTSRAELALFQFPLLQLLAALRLQQVFVKPRNIETVQWRREEGRPAILG